MKSYLLAIILLFIPIHSYSQQSYLDTLYAGGEAEYSAFFHENLHFPVSLLINKVEGFLIYEIHVTSEGKVAIRFMTKLDSNVEKEVTDFIQAMAGNWVKRKQDYKVYQTIAFSLDYFFVKDFNGNIEGFPLNFKYPMLELHTAMAVVSNMGQPMMEPEEIYEKEKGKKLNRYNKLVSDLEKALKKKKLKRAYRAINQIIRYNPFDKQLIQQRRGLEKQLGLDEYRVYDILWLQALDKISTMQNKKP